MDEPDLGPTDEQMGAPAVSGANLNSLMLILSFAMRKSAGPVARAREPGATRRECRGRERPSGFLSVMGQAALGDRFSPSLLIVPLAVLSPGPRLAGTPSKGKK
jgi:hypothetical protein